MSREIKFRAWTGKEMIYDALSAKRMPASTFDNIKFPAYYAAGMKTCHMQELMQFTGLRDANGVEIYEGDILSVMTAEVTGDNIYNDEDFIEGKSKYHTGKKIESTWTIEHVFYHCFTGYRFYGLNRRFNIPATKSVIVNNKAKVIGNIYEHPHLLDGSK